MATRLTTAGAKSGRQKTGALGAAMSGSVGKSQPPIGGCVAAIAHSLVVCSVALVPSQALPGKPRETEAIEMVVGPIVAPIAGHGRSLRNCVINSKSPRANDIRPLVVLA